MSETKLGGSWIVKRAKGEAEHSRECARTGGEGRAFWGGGRGGGGEEAKRQKAEEEEEEEEQQQEGASEGCRDGKRTGRGREEGESETATEPARARGGRRGGALALSTRASAWSCLRLAGAALPPAKKSRSLFCALHAARWPLAARCSTVDTRQGTVWLAYTRPLAGSLSLSRCSVLVVGGPAERQSPRKHPRTRSPSHGFSQRGRRTVLECWSAGALVLCCRRRSFPAAQGLVPTFRCRCSSADRATGRQVRVVCVAATSRDSSAPPFGRTGGEDAAVPDLAASPFTFAGGGGNFTFTPGPAGCAARALNRYGGRPARGQQPPTLLHSTTPSASAHKTSPSSPPVSPQERRRKVDVDRDFPALLRPPLIGCSAPPSHLPVPSHGRRRLPLVLSANLRNLLAPLVTFVRMR